MASWLISWNLFARQHMIEAKKLKKKWREKKTQFLKF